jgi:hypothetical protein
MNKFLELNDVIFMQGYQAYPSAFGVVKQLNASPNWAQTTDIMSKISQFETDRVSVHWTDSDWSWEFIEFREKHTERFYYLYVGNLDDPEFDKKFLAFALSHADNVMHSIEDLKKL